VDADEDRGIEEGFQFADGLLLQVALAFAVQGDVIVLRFHVVEFGDGDDVDADAILHHDTLRPFACGTGRGDGFARNLAGADPVAGALQGAGKAGGVEGLEQVIHGVCVEGAHGVLVVRGDEDDGRHAVAVDELQDFEPVQFRHLDVEEKQVGGEFGDGLDGLEAVGALGSDADVRVGAEEFAEVSTRQFLVIYDDGGEGAGGCLGSHRRTGSRVPTSRLPIFVNEYLWENKKILIFMNGPPACWAVRKAVCELPVRDSV
jgi:hypothetical protein